MCAKQGQLLPGGPGGLCPSREGCWAGALQLLSAAGNRLGLFSCHWEGRWCPLPVLERSVMAKSRRWFHQPAALFPLVGLARIQPLLYQVPGDAAGFPRPVEFYLLAVYKYRLHKY